MSGGANRASMSHDRWWEGKQRDENLQFFSAHAATLKFMGTELRHFPNQGEIKWNFFAPIWRQLHRWFSFRGDGPEVYIWLVPIPSSVARMQLWTISSLAVWWRTMYWSMVKSNLKWKQSNVITVDRLHPDWSNPMRFQRSRVARKDFQPAESDAAPRWWGGAQII